MRQLAKYLIPICVVLLSLQQTSAFLVVGLPLAAFSHQSITLIAASDLSATECVASTVADKVAEVDFAENTLTGHPVLGVYDGAHHFDRKPGQTHQDAFTAGLAYFRNSQFFARQLLMSGIVAQGLEQLGDALHSLQDLIAHSNLVDAFSDAEQNAFLLAVLNGTATFDPKLKLMYYDPANPNADDSSGKDPYSYTHKSNAKDYLTSPFHTIAGLKASDATEWLLSGLSLGSALCKKEPPILEITPVTSLDPNDKAGAQGVGQMRHVSGNDNLLPYSVYFENQPTASAPAQSVRITDTLTTNLDPTTVTLGPITFPNQVVTPPLIPLSVAPFTTTVDLRPANNLLVKISASLNTTTSILTWTFQSLDPATNQPPADPLAGFLPPGAEGSVFFTVMPKSTVTTGTVIQNTATVIFDVNAPISTPTWSNTIDSTRPISHVNQLAATQTTTSFMVSWAGSDAGAGVQDFTVYASDNGGSFTSWQTNTPATSATFTGTVGHTYRFYSIARDLVGNVEKAKSTAEATTTLIAPPTIQCTGCYFLISGVRATLAFNVASVGTASTFTYNYRTSTQTVQFASTTTSQISVSGNTATFSGQGKLNGVAGYNFTVTAKDGGGVGSGLDTVAIAITGPNNYSYSANATIAGGDIVVKQ